MKKTSVRPTDEEIEDAVNTYSDMLFRLCFVLLGSDAEDAVSETFLRLITSSPSFEEEEHKKAWLIRVATNVCRDMHRYRKRNNHLSLDSIENYCSEKEDRKILAEVIRLPEKYKTVIHLFYFEGYKTAEIAEILSLSASAVRKRLQYGREKLRFEYERSCFE